MAERVFLSTGTRGYGFASTKTIEDWARFAKMIGFETIQVRKEFRRFPAFYREVSDAWHQARVVAAPYPYFTSPVTPMLSALDAFWLPRIRRHQKAGMSIALFADLPIEQRIGAGLKAKAQEFARETRILSAFDVHLVANEPMQRALEARGIKPRLGFVEYELMDYDTDFVPLPEPATIGPPWAIAYAGNTARSGFGPYMEELPMDPVVSYHVWGHDSAWIAELNRADVVLHVPIPPASLLPEMSKRCHFGILRPSTEHEGYDELTATSKLSAYACAGLPMLVRKRHRWLASRVEKYGIGITFSDFADVPSTLSKITDSQYRAMHTSALELAAKLRTGGFIRGALEVAIGRGG
ncbi:MAG: hypothetical protein ACYDDF_08255 [Thermoplasmatota archaeon]